MKKIFISLILFVVLASSFVSPVDAQTSTNGFKYENPDTIEEVKVLNGRGTFKREQNVIVCLDENAFLDCQVGNMNLTESADINTTNQNVYVHTCDQGFVSAPVKILTSLEPSFQCHYTAPDDPNFNGSRTQQIFANWGMPTGIESNGLNAFINKKSDELLFNQRPDFDTIAYLKSEFIPGYQDAASVYANGIGSGGYLDTGGSGSSDGNPYPDQPENQSATDDDEEFPQWGSQYGIDPANQSGSGSDWGSQYGLSDPPVFDDVSGNVGGRGAVFLDFAPASGCNSGSGITSGYCLFGSSGAIVEFWRWSRNIAYLMFVLILVAAGFMIMFRHKIGGQMAVTIFNTLPRVVFALVGVTFSFAIVGFIIDLSMMATRILNNLITVGDQSLVFVSNPVGLLTSGFGGLGSGLISSWGEYVTSSTGAGSGIGGRFIFGALTAILSIVGVGMVVFVSIKIYISLVKCYLGLAIDAIVGPLYIMASAIPGKSHLFMKWGGRVAKNAFSFTAITFAINLAYLSAALVPDINLAALATGDPDINLINDNQTGEFLLEVIIPYMILFYIPGIPKALEDVFMNAQGQGLRGASDAFTQTAAKAKSYLPI